jgi:epoxide hydrolase 4
MARPICAAAMTNASPHSEFSWTPDPASGISMRFVEATGQRVELVEAGDAESSKLAIMLHGIPQLDFSWRHQMPVLASAP